MITRFDVYNTIELSEQKHHNKEKNEYFCLVRRLKFFILYTYRDREREIHTALLYNIYQCQCEYIFCRRHRRRLSTTTTTTTTRRRRVIVYTIHLSVCDFWARPSTNIGLRLNVCARMRWCVLLIFLFA